MALLGKLSTDHNKCVFWHFYKCSGCSCRLRKHGLGLAVFFMPFCSYLAIQTNKNSWKFVEKKNILKTKYFICKNSGLSRKRNICIIKFNADQTELLRKQAKRRAYNLLSFFFPPPLLLSCYFFLDCSCHNWILS